MFPKSTSIPNFILDTHLPDLTESELKVLLVVIRQTLGWRDIRTGARKTRDRISGSQFRLKTGLSKRVITNAVERLSKKELLTITDYQGLKLKSAKERKGKSYLYYSVNLPVHNPAQASAQCVPSPAHNANHNKIKRKEVRQRADAYSGHIGELMAKKPLYAKAVV